MKKLIVALGVGSLVFLGFGCSGVDTVLDTNNIAENEVSTDGVSGLLRENALLMLQAGRIGVDAPRRAEWAGRAQAVSQLIAENKINEATVELSSLNVEMRTAIVGVGQ